MFSGYTPGRFYDEMFEASGVPRPHYASLHSLLEGMTPADFDARRDLAELALVNQGITFTVYGDEQGIEKPFPLDLVPRILPAS